MKSLPLSPLFKTEDWEGLTEILQVVDEKTKRSDLPLLMRALKKSEKGYQNRKKRPAKNLLNWNRKN